MKLKDALDYVLEEKDRECVFKLNGKIVTIFSDYLPTTECLFVYLEQEGEYAQPLTISKELWDTDFHIN